MVHHEIGNVMTKIGIYYNIKYSEKKHKRVEDNTEVNLTPLTSKCYVKNKLRKKLYIFNTHGKIHNIV